MKKAILARKIGMTQIFNENGSLIPVTVLKAGPLVVTRIKTDEIDGYNAVVVGFEDANEKDGKAHRHALNKAEAGVFKKSNIKPKRILKEFRFDDISTYEVGSEIKADIFEAGDFIDATAISKGKGFQGAIKRHNQHRGPMAHGSKFHRHAGSNGAASDPSKVFKGKKMPGHMGSVKVTIQNLEVVKVDAEQNIILVKGSMPGSKNQLVTIKETVKSL